MDSYRIYGLDAKGRIRFGDYVQCEGEDEAVKQASLLLAHYHDAEVWMGARRVASPERIKQRG